MLTTRINHFLNHYSFARVWLIFFLLTLLIIFSVQLIILPYILPAWHAGDGLLIGGDWISFHKLAVRQAERIQTEGWSAWQLWPNGWLPSGIASALYTFTWPKPWVVAPLNAAVHAFTALMVIKIMLLFTKSRAHALLASLPYLFFPSAMLWYTQLHRDGYNILGMLLLLYALLQIVSSSEGRSAKLRFGRSEAVPLALALAGITLLWVSRPHTLVLFQYATILLAAIILAYLVVGGLKGQWLWREVLRKAALVFTILIFFLPFTQLGGGSKYELVPIDTGAAGTEPQPLLWARAAVSEGGTKPLSAVCKVAPAVIGSGQVAAADSIAADITLLSAADEIAVEAEVEDAAGEKWPEDIMPIEDFVWHRTRLLPERIDNQLYSAAAMRTVWFPRAYSGAASYIDRDISFHSAVDFIYYLPRALQIAYLAPFPADWFGEGTYQSTTFFRRVSAFEMIFIYFALLAFIATFWRWRKKIEIYLVLLFATFMMLPMVYSIPNLGTIYRYRYGYIMLIVCLGLLGLLEYLSERKGKARKDFR